MKKKRCLCYAERSSQQLGSSSLQVQYPWLGMLTIVQVSILYGYNNVKLLNYCTVTDRKATLLMFKSEWKKTTV
eukprot:4166243-Amphidinium_carterae.1